MLELPRYEPSLVFLFASPLRFSFCAVRGERGILFVATALVEDLVIDTAQHPQNLSKHESVQNRYGSESFSFATKFVTVVGQREVGKSLLDQDAEHGRG